MTARWIEALALVALAWTVAGPLSVRFARARWAAREPVAALVMWQAIGLSGGLAVLTAELTLTASRRDGPWRDAVFASVRSPAHVGALGAVGLVLLIGSAGWLVGVLVTSFVRVIQSRREHRALLALLSRPERADDTAFEVIDASTPVAYSLPGRTSHVVLSSAARATLSEPQLCAVLAHERAHLRQRHGVLVQPFIAWERSVPWLAAPALARRRVEQLVEMVCDDAAVVRTDAGALSSALLALLPVGSDARERTERLGLVGMRSARLRGSLIGVAVVIVVVPPLVLAVLPV